MKRLLPFILLLISCKAIDNYNYLTLPRFDIYYGDFGEITDYSDISRYLRNNTEYLYEGINHYIQGPEETVELKTGDCDDFAVLFLNIAYTELGIKGNLVYVNSNERTIVNGGIPNHVIVEYDGIAFDPVYRNTYTNVMYRYTFGEVFND